MLWLFGLKIVGNLRWNGDATWLRVDYHAAHSRGIATIGAISVIGAISAISTISAISAMGVVGGGQDHGQPVMNDRVERGNQFDVLNGDAESVFILFGQADHTNFAALAAVLDIQGKENTRKNRDRPSSPAIALQRSFRSRRGEADPCSFPSIRSKARYPQRKPLFHE